MGRIWERARRVAATLVLAAGAIATAASNGPTLGPALSAEEGPFTVVLSASALEAEVSFTALLDAQAEVVPGSGEVGIQVELDPGSTASLTFGLTSNVTGASNEAEIIDSSVQDQARVGIEAFAGCTGDTPCEEGFVAHFARLDDANDSELEVTWYVDGLVEVVLGEDEEPMGSLELRVAQ